MYWDSFPLVAFALKNCDSENVRDPSTIPTTRSPIPSNELDKTAPWFWCAFDLDHEEQFGSRRDVGSGLFLEARESRRRKEEEEDVRKEKKRKECSLTVARPLLIEPTFRLCTRASLHCRYTPETFHAVIIQGVPLTDLLFPWGSWNLVTELC